MSTFGLVHGAWHGAWCWENLEAELQSRGHRTIAMDLPVDEIGAEGLDYANAVVDALAEEDDVVLVGHSLGGLTIPVVAELRPVRHLVYVAALVPEPGVPAMAWVSADMIHDNFRAAAMDDGRSQWTDEALAIECFYHDAEPDAAHQAFLHLRPQASTLLEEASPLKGHPAATPSTYIVCDDDRALRPEWCRDTCRRRLGLEPVEFPGSHSPFLARPAEVAEVLVMVAP